MYTPIGKISINGKVLNIVVISTMSAKKLKTNAGGWTSGGVPRRLGASWEPLGNVLGLALARLGALGLSWKDLGGILEGILAGLGGSTRG